MGVQHRLHCLGDLQELGTVIATIGSNGKVGTFWYDIYVFLI